MRGVEDAAPYTGDGGAVQAGGVEPRPYAGHGGSCVYRVAAYMGAALRIFL